MAKEKEKEARKKTEAKILKKKNQTVEVDGRNAVVHPNSDL